MTVILSVPAGSMSFSVNRSKIEPKKPSKKIGNLFSDAWKKGNQFDAKVMLKTTCIMRRKRVVKCRKGLTDFSVSNQLKYSCDELIL